jgi:DNA-binding NtrC family response regulator
MQNSRFLSFTSKSDYQFFKDYCNVNKVTVEELKVGQKFNELRTFLTSDEPISKDINNSRTGSVLSILSYIFNEFKNLEITKPHTITIIVDLNDPNNEFKCFLEQCIKALNLSNYDITFDFVQIDNNHSSDLFHLVDLLKDKYSCTSDSEIMLVNHSAGNSLMQGATFIVATNILYNLKTKSFVVTKSEEPSIIKIQRESPNLDIEGSKKKNIDLVELENETHYIEYKNICRRLMPYAKSSAPIFLAGESGSGKEVLANAIAKYIFKKRRDELPEVEKKTYLNWHMHKRNCAAIPDTLIDTEFFGYEKGSHSEAKETKAGIFEIANKSGGILFLDEICDLSLDAQAKILRVIQEREFYRVGGITPVKLNKNFLIISASHKNIWLQVALQNFREDLAHRLTSIEESIPSLADRAKDSHGINDIKQAARGIFNQLVEDGQITLVEKLNDDELFFDSDCDNLIQNFSWRGNYRTLEKIVTRLAIEKGTKPPYNYSDLKEQLIRIEKTFGAVEKYKDNSSSNNKTVIPENLSNSLKIDISRNEIAGDIQSNCDFTLFIECEDDNPRFSYNSFEKVLKSEIFYSFTEKYKTQDKSSIALGVSTGCMSTNIKK